MTPTLAATLILFTFDGHPNKSTDKILPILKRYNIRATFFVLGSRLLKPENRKRLRRIALAGHTIGNHLWSHRSPCKMGAKETIRELLKTQKLIRKVLGRSSSRLYRPPHGHRCYVRQIKRAGFRVVMWTPGLADLGNSGQRIWHRLRARMIKLQKSVLLIHHNWGKLAFILRRIYGR
jgi:peptidoglycan/xylan/chitin deacetylase (PgdA/CDA1 family)